MPVRPLDFASLRPRELSAELEFETTDQLEDLEAPLGQQRAADALRLAVTLGSGAHNAYVMGPAGVGKHAVVLQTLERAAADAATPSDWCYLNDFSDPRRPRAVELPAGRARDLRRDMERLVSELRVAIPAAFESVEYRMRVHALEKQLEEARESALEAVRVKAHDRGVALLRTPVGFGFAPTKDGEVVEPDRFHDLPVEEQERFKRDIGELQEMLQETLRAMPVLERRHRERVKEVNRDVALFAAGHLVEELRRRYADLPSILEHLDAVLVDVVENVHDFLSGSEDGSDVSGQIRKLFVETPTLRRYSVNVLVDHPGRRGAPVASEDLPTLPNLAGRIEHHAHFGTLVTDFTMIRPGALHRANGGYLVLDAARVLAQPFAWDALKRALRSREIRVETPERLLGIAGTVTLEPTPIPLDVTVVLIGDRLVHHLLSQLDPEFLQLFKIVADFEDSMPRTPDTELGYARFVATVARREGLRPLDRGAVERLVREASRIEGDATRLTARTSAIHDLLREAEHLAGSAGRRLVTGRDVRDAVDARERRSGRTRERVQDELRRGTLVLDTEGARVGQVNGISVVDAGTGAFGRPVRITASVRLGRGEVVDIEREVALGGPIHSKGVLILAGYLGGRYCAARPLTLAATIVFEQSYSGVEGDSASSAELYALLSAIGDVPLSQSLAVTGSVDQHGRVQAVGGVNEKVEGFFDVCSARGLTGREGVLIPAANVQHLVLRDDVLAAVQERRFHVYPVATADEGIELLSGVPAGAPDASGAFPDGSVGQRVATRLDAFAERARQFAEPLGRDDARRP